MTPADGATDEDARRMFDMAPCGYATLTWDGRFIAVNETFLRWTGYAREDLVGQRSLGDLMGKAAQIYGQTHLRPMMLMGGMAREIALDLQCQDGTRLPVLLNAAMERDEAGEPHLIRIAIFDASERRAYEQELRRAKERAEASEERVRLLARTLQSTLIPPSPPEVPGLELGAAYRPAGNGEEIGGDFYEVYQRRTGEWVVVLGDVCGKGVDAAVVTALARYSLRAAVVENESPAAALRVLNQIVLDHSTDRFCTVVLMYLHHEGDDWRVRVSVGGHPPPIVVPHEGPAAPAVVSGSLVGVLDDPDFVDREIVLGAGDALVVYTDGVTEGRSGAEFFGDDRMHTSIEARRGSAPDMATGLLDDVLAFQDGRSRDDVAIVSVRVPERVAALSPA